MTNWEECVAYIRQYKSDTEQEAYSSYLESMYDGVFKMLEDEFDCQGICAYSRFWMYKEVDMGPPTSFCAIKMK